jgi:hypothetical protein
MGYQTIDSKLENASLFFQGLEERWAGKSRETPLREFVYGIKDKTGNSISQYEAFKVLFSVMEALDSYSGDQLDTLASKGLPCVGTLLKMPLMFSYERKNAGMFYSKMDLSSFTLGDVKNIDFLRYAVLIESYRAMLAHENY